MNAQGQSKQASQGTGGARQSWNPLKFIRPLLAVLDRVASNKLESKRALGRMLAEPFLYKQSLEAELDKKMQNSGLRTETQKIFYLHNWLKTELAGGQPDLTKAEVALTMLRNLFPLNYDMGCVKLAARQGLTDAVTQIWLDIRRGGILSSR